MKRLMIFCLCLLSLVSCVKETDWTTQGGIENMIVVDGILTSERKTQTITINHPVNDLNGKALPVSGATVVLLTSDSTWQLTENPAGSGRYLTSSTFIALPGKTYTLNIFNGSSVYSAQAGMVPGASFEPLSYLMNEHDSLYHVEFVASAFSSSSPAMWELLLDWTAVPGYQNADSSACKARMLFYTLPTLDVSEIFAPVVEQLSFPKGTVITERRYSLTPQHAGFIRALLLETSWQGGLFPTEAANVQGNLSSGAFGYFGVCAVNELSVIVGQ